MLQVPEHVRHQVSEQDLKAKEVAAAAAAAAALQSSVKVTVLLDGGPEETIISADKRKPLSELIARAAEAFGVPVEAAPELEQAKKTKNDSGSLREAPITLADVTPAALEAMGRDGGLSSGAARAGTASRSPRRAVAAMGTKWAKGDGDSAVISDDDDDGVDSAGGETDRETHDEGRSDGGGSGGDIAVAATTNTSPSAVISSFLGGGEPDNAATVGALTVGNMLSANVEGTTGDIYGARTAGKVAPADGYSYGNGAKTQGVGEMRNNAVACGRSLDGDGELGVPPVPPPMPPAKRPPPVRLVRLREYLNSSRLAGPPFDESSTPGELFFLHGRKVLLETRKPGMPWPRFDRNDINVSIIRFESSVGIGRDAADAHAVVGPGDVSGGEDGAAGGNGAVADAAEKDRASPPRPREAPLPVLGTFAPERNTRLKPSGTVREIRAALAAFAGTDEDRTRVFTMCPDSAEDTYKVLCQPPCVLRRRRSVDVAAVTSSAAENDSRHHGRDVREPSASKPRLPVVVKNEENRHAISGIAASEERNQGSKNQQPLSVITGGITGFTTAAAVAAAEQAQRHEGITPGATASLVPGGGSLLESTTALFSDLASGSYGRESSPSHIAGETSWFESTDASGLGDDVMAVRTSEVVECGEEEIGENDIVVLGDRGTTHLHRVYMQELAEWEEDEEEGGRSLAVRVATDDANRCRCSRGDFCAYVVVGGARSRGCNSGHLLILCKTFHSRRFQRCRYREISART